MSIDPTALESYREFMGEQADAFIQDILASYRENSPALLDTMAAALESVDQEAFTRAAHTLKSNSATIGATALAQTSAALEQLGRTGQLAEAGASLARAREELSAALHALQEHYP